MIVNGTAVIRRGLNQQYHHGIQCITSIRYNSSNTVSVSASLVKELREKSGAGMMDCKKALANAEVGGDIQKAIEWLRKKGVSKVMSKGNERSVSEGLIGVFINNKSNKVTLVEVNSETDFVGRNVEFQKFVASVAATVNQHFDDNAIINVSDVLTKPYMNIDSSTSSFISPPVAVTVNNQLEDIISRIREPISIARVINIAATDQHTLQSHYVHSRIGQEVLPQHIQVLSYVSTYLSIYLSAYIMSACVAFCNRLIGYTLLYCAVKWFFVKLYYTVLCYTMFYYATLSHPMFYSTVLYSTTSCYV